MCSEPKWEMSKNIKYSKFKVYIFCVDCKAEMNSTEEMTADELRDRWTSLSLKLRRSLNKCKEGCRSIYTDLNSNIHTAIIDVDTATEVSFGIMLYLFGKFYQSDYSNVCSCKTDIYKDFWYHSDSYPSVHGRCGKWILPYKRPARGE